MNMIPRFEQQPRSRYRPSPDSAVGMRSSATDFSPLGPKRNFFPNGPNEIIANLDEAIHLGRAEVVMKGRGSHRKPAVRPKSSRDVNVRVISNDYIKIRSSNPKMIKDAKKKLTNAGFVDGTSIYVFPDLPPYS